MPWGLQASRGPPRLVLDFLTQAPGGQIPPNSALSVRRLVETVLPRALLGHLGPWLALAHTGNSSEAWSLPFPGKARS